MRLTGLVFFEAISGREIKRGVHKTINEHSWAVNDINIETFVATIPVVVEANFSSHNSVLGFRMPTGHPAWGVCTAGRRSWTG
jgi:hypothetical protein